MQSIMKRIVLIHAEDFPGMLDQYWEIQLHHPDISSTGSLEELVHAMTVGHIAEEWGKGAEHAEECRFASQSYVKWCVHILTRNRL